MTGSGGAVLLSSVVESSGWPDKCSAVLLLQHEHEPQASVLGYEELLHKACAACVLGSQPRSSDQLIGMSITVERGTPLPSAQGIQHTSTEPCVHAIGLAALLRGGPVWIAASQSSSWQGSYPPSYEISRMAAALTPGHAPIQTSPTTSMEFRAYYNLVVFGPPPNYGL